MAAFKSTLPAPSVHVPLAVPVNATGTILVPLALAVSLAVARESAEFRAPGSAGGSTGTGPRWRRRTRAAPSSSAGTLAALRRNVRRRNRDCVLPPQRLFYMVCVYYFNFKFV